MNISIAYIEDIGVRFPPGNLTDSLLPSIQESVAKLAGPGFDHLSIYMHLPGKDNTFGMPVGVKLRLEKRAREMVATAVLDGDRYMQLVNWDDKLDMCVDGVIETVNAVCSRCRIDAADRIRCLALLESSKRGKQ